MVPGDDDPVLCVVPCSVPCVRPSVVFCAGVLVELLEGLEGQGGEQRDDLQEHLGHGTPSKEAFNTLLGVWKSTWNI